MEREAEQPGCQMLRPDPGGAGGGRALVRWGFGLGLMLVSILAFRLIGPVHAIRGSTRLVELTPLLYLFPVFLPIGMLVGDTVQRALTRDCRGALALGCGLVCLVLLAAGRFAFLIPLSGHAVVLGFFLFWYAREALVGHLVVGGLLLLQVTYYKLVVWRDPVTLGLGLLAGAALAAALVWGVDRVPHSVDGPGCG